MRFEVYINKVMFLETYNCDEAFAYFRDWLSNGYNVSIKFVRTEPLAA